MKKKSQEIDFRVIIESKLRSFGWSRPKLASKLRETRYNTLSRYLRGELDLTGGKIAEILSVLRVRRLSVSKEKSSENFADKMSDPLPL